MPIDSAFPFRNSDATPVGPDMDASPWAPPILDPLSRIANYSERQREKNAPTVIDLTAGSGNAIDGQQVNVYRLRVIGLLISASAATTLVFTAGGRSYTFYVAAGMEPLIHFPIEIDGGTDISVNLTGAAANYSFYIFGYTEGAV
jgi:hypothetical protein